MPKLTKRIKSDTEKAPADPVSVGEAVGIVKSFGKTKFNQTVDICMHLGVDPKHADQLVRGSISLPHGTGKTARVICFCGSDKEEAAKAAGAIEAGGEDLVKKITDGWIDFDVAIASPDMMRFVGKLGKQLGPRGLMPSPKAGTVTPNIENAIKEYAAGKIEFRTDKGGNVHAPVGKLDFDADKLEENTQAFIDLVLKLKPSTAKGQYIKRVTLSGTMTPGVQIAV